MKKILVLTDDMPWGHRSIAKAIFNFLKEKETEVGYQVDYTEVRSEPHFAYRLYKFAYRYLPKSWGLNENINKLKWVRYFYSKIFDLGLSNLRLSINRFNPDLIISTYFGHSHALANWRKAEDLDFKLWTVVADPWTSSPIGFVKDCDLSLVYDEKAEDLVVKYGIDPKKVLKTGWWVRPEMYSKFDQKEVRKKYEIPNGGPVIFVGGGSFGNNSIFKILPMLDSINEKAVFVFNTGTDRLAYDLIEQKKKNLKNKGNKIVIKNFGWIENMAEILSACDMVLGKAGPNFLFDCVACGKPFVAITHISGQEDGNLELIKKKKLGWVKETTEEIADFLHKYIKNPALYENKCRKEIKEEALRNEKSLEVVLDKIKKDLVL